MVYSIGISLLKPSIHRSSMVYILFSITSTVVVSVFPSEITICVESDSIDPSVEKI